MKPHIFKNKEGQRFKSSLAHSYKKELKRKPTKTEFLLYEEFRKLRPRPKFQRLIFNYRSFYIMDFYFANKRICIEVDGISHINNNIYDLERDIFVFKKQGIITIRISNNFVLDKYKEIANNLVWMVNDCPNYKTGKLKKQKDKERIFFIKKYFADWGVKSDEASVHRKVSELLTSVVPPNRNGIRE